MGTTCVSSEPAPALANDSARPQPKDQPLGLRGWKIAIASSGLGHVNRGIEAWASDVASALAQRGVPVTLFKGGGRAEKTYERVLPCLRRNSRGIQQLLCLVPPPVAWRLSLADPYSLEQVSFTLRLLKYLRRERFDLLHVQDFLVARMVQKARALGLVNTRTIVGHGTNESHEFLQRISYLQHLAPYYLEEARAAGCWKPTWTAIPNFVETECFYPGRDDELRLELGIPRDAFVVLTAAAISKVHKRVDYLVREFQQVLHSYPKAPLHLVVAGGRAPDTEELVRQGQAALGDRVRFLVQFPRQRMANLYRAADIFVLCSLREMMPIALLEATASGLPCLVHDQVVLRWITGPGSWVLNMEQSGALAAGIEKLFVGSRTREALARQSRQHCLANFSRDRVVDQLLDYYRLVLGHAPSQASS